MAGFIAAGNELGFELIPTIFANASPKGPVTSAAFEELTAQLTTRMSQLGPLEGIFLALHGAMYTEAFPQADEEIVRRLRATVGQDIPLVVTHDFHADIARHRGDGGRADYLSTESARGYQAARRTRDCDSGADPGRRDSAEAGVGEAPSAVEYRSPEHFTRTAEIDYRGKYRTGERPRRIRRPGQPAR